MHNTPIMSLTPFKQPGDVLWDDPIITYKMLLTYQLNYAINDFYPVLYINLILHCSCVTFVVVSQLCVKQ